MTDPRDAGPDSVVQELEEAGLVEEYTDINGDTAYRLTTEGKAVGRQLAMTEGEDERLAVLNELLGEE